MSYRPLWIITNWMNEIHHEQIGDGDVEQVLTQSFHTF